MAVKHRAQCKSSGQCNSTHQSRSSVLPNSQSNVCQIFLVVLLLHGAHRGLRGPDVGVLENLTAGAAELVRIGRRVEHLMARGTLEHGLEVDRIDDIYLCCRLLVLRIHLLLRSILRGNVLALLVGLVVRSVLLVVVHLLRVLLLRVWLLRVLLIGLHHSLSS